MPEDRITAALRGPQPPLVQMGGSANQQDGTAASGYATPDLGPFECENCVKFAPSQLSGGATQGSEDGGDMGSGQSTAAPGQCNDPRVQQDAEVQGQVEAQGCCNFFQSAHNESQAEEHGEPEQEQ